MVGSLYRALRTARALTRYYNLALKPVDLLGTQLSLMATVGEAGTSSVARLAEKLATDASTLTRNIAVLEGRGLLEPDTGRGRAGKRVSLTQAGSRGVESICHGRRHGTGRDDVDANVVRPQFDGHYLGQVVHGGL